MYYITPNYCVAHNPKVGCSSMAMAIIETFYPDLFDQYKNLTNIKWQFVCKYVQIPDKPVVLLVRNPLDRFVSAVAETDIDIDVAIDCLANDKYYHFPHFSKPKKLRQDGHFKKQSSLIYGKTLLFKFPDQIQNVVGLLKLKNFPHLNRAKNKNLLADPHVEFIQYYYKEDFELFGGLL